MRRVTPEEREQFRTAVSRGVAAARPPAKKRRPHKHRPAEHAAEAAEPAKDASGKRRTTRDERELFQAVVAGHSPVRKPAAAKAKTPAAPAKPVPQKSPAGLDGNTARKLKRGEIAPAAKLDLHGLTEASAHRALKAFVLSAHGRGDRLVLVVTGKGGVSADPERPRGVLKSLVPRWLDEAPMAKLIAEMRWAHIRHGGEGALYVYLRKAKA